MKCDECGSENVEIKIVNMPDRKGVNMFECLNCGEEWEEKE